MRGKRIFLHGFLGTPSDWEPLLSLGLSGICPSLPGHGNTPFVTNWSWFPKLEEPCHLIGYSMGGRIAMAFATQFPHKVASLTLLSTRTSAVENLEERKEWEKGWAHQLRSLSLPDFCAAWYAQSLFGGFIPNCSLRHLHDKEALLEAFLHYSVSQFPIPKNPFPGRVHLVGERDPLYRDSVGAIQISNAAHMVHLENPHEVLQWMP